METMLGFIGLLALSFHLAPQVTRRDIFFGITVSPAFRDGPVARSVSRRYAIEVWGIALAAAAFVATSPMPVISGPMLLAQTLGASVAFARARHTVRPHAAAPTTIREAEIGPRPALPGGLIGQLGPFLILFAAAVYVGLHWEEIPAKFPTHWNMAGRPNGWTAKSAGGVFRGITVGFVACAIMLFTSYAVLHWTRLPRVTGADGAQSLRVRRVNLIATLASEYLVASSLAWTSVVSMFSDPSGQPRLPLAFRVAPFALVIIGTITVRVMRRSAAAEGPPIGDTTPDSCWFVGGHLYVNRADPTLFVEKRTGLGYTLNLGNPVAWLVVIAIALALSIPLLLVA
jgi:uncharacterized membrane protein